MKRLLAISWSMLPVQVPRSIQVARVLKGLSQAGWQHTAIGCRPCWPDRTLVPLDDDLAAVYRPFVNTRYVNSTCELFMRMLLGRVYPSLKYRPDTAVWWGRRARRVARGLLRTEAFDVLVSFGQPWSDHLAALALRREFCIPWIAHFSDPWADSPYLPTTPAVRQYARGREEAVMAGADRLVFVSEETRKLVMAKYPREWGAKACVIPHAFDGDGVAGPAPAGAEPCRDRLVLLYSGTFYRNRRTPAPLFRALARLRAEQPELAASLELQFAGSAGDEYKSLATGLGLGAQVRFLGPLSYADNARACRAADVLLVIDAPADASVFLPSKLIDYLAFAKPILGITPPVGASAELLRRLDCPLAGPDDEAGIAAALAALANAWRTGPLTVSPRFRDAAAQYSLATVTGQWSGLLSCVA